MKTRSSAQMKRFSAEMKNRSSAEMKKRSSAELKMSLECEVMECNFKTPTLDVQEYAAMVRHLQLHTKLIHGVEVAGCSCQNKKKAGAGKTLPLSSAKPRNRTRSRSRRRSNVGELDFPCPDCNLQSFATEAGLYMHRRRSCDLRWVEPRGLNFPCHHGEGCGRAFSSPLGLAIHRRSCIKFPEVAQGADDSRKEDSDGEKMSRRSRTERGATHDDGWVVQEERGQGREEQVSRSERGATVGGERIVQWGTWGTAKPHTQCLQEVTPVQRSTTSSPGVSSSSRQDFSGRRPEDLKVEMEVMMSLRNGKIITTKYRVSGQAAMQCVIIKAALKMEREVNAVRMFKQGIEVLGTSKAVDYAGSCLVAKF